jgi:hypothetical protein
LQPDDQLLYVRVEWCLATQHRELMAQDENLEVFRGVTAGEPHEQLNGAAHGKVREFR